MGKYVTMAMEIANKIIAYKEKIVEIPYNICIGCISVAVVFLLIAIILDCKRYW